MPARRITTGTRPSTRPRSDSTPRNAGRSCSATGSAGGRMPTRSSTRWSSRRRATIAAYLGRGRYLELAARSNAGGKGGGDDFRKALELAPDRPEVYLELAVAESRQSRLDAAREILDKGVEAVPKAAILYRALADLEQKAGRGDRAIDTLELGLKELPDELNLHWQLALILAERGDSGKLLLHVAELERLEANRLYTQYLRAYYHFNKHEYAQARQILAPLQPELTLVPGVKALVECAAGEVLCRAGRARAAAGGDAAGRRLGPEGHDGPEDVDTGADEPGRDRPGDQGVSAPGAGTAGAGPWGAGDAAAPAESPAAAGAAPVGRDRAADRPDRPRRRPARPSPRCCSPGCCWSRARRRRPSTCWRRPAGSTPRTPGRGSWRRSSGCSRRRWDEARSLLDRADKQFGDRVELRLARADLVVNQGGPQVIPALNELTGASMPSRARTAGRC